MSAPENSSGTSPGDASGGARCEYCGLSYADAAGAPGGAATGPSPPREAPPAAEPGAEPTTETHCEYCGIEYPVPRKDPEAG